MEMTGDRVALQKGGRVRMEIKPRKGRGCWSTLQCGLTKCGVIRCFHLMGYKTQSGSLRQDEDPNKEGTFWGIGFPEAKCWYEEGTRKG